MRSGALALVVLFAAGGCGGSDESTQLVSSATACTVVDQSGSLHGLSWYRPSDDENVDELERWCDSVGPPVFIPAPLPGGLPTPRASAVQSGDTIVVISWNVHVGQGSVTRLLDALGAIGADTHVVLLLQEVLRRSDSVPAPPVRLELPRAIRRDDRRAEDIAEVAGARNLSLLYAPSMRNGDDASSGSREDRGNAILATLPLLTPRVIELPFRQQRRVAVAANLPIAAASADLEQRPTAPAIRFLSAHVDTRAGGDQARALAGLLRQWSGDVPLFVGSDLNALFGRFDPRTRAVSGAVRRRDCGGRSYLHLLSLDQVFTDLDGWVRSCRVLGDRFGSDHAPLVAKLTVP